MEISKIYYISVLIATVLGWIWNMVRAINNEDPDD